MKENYAHRDLIRSSSKKMIELDVYLPIEKLAFEYQGEHHFNDIYALGNKWIQQQRDEEKKRLCIEKDITLIEIPYWWDNEKSSLAATIHKIRPDLIPLTMIGNGIAIENNEDSLTGI